MNIEHTWICPLSSETSIRGRFRHSSPRFNWTTHCLIIRDSAVIVRNECGIRVPAPLPLALVSFVWTLRTGLQVVKLVQRSPQRKEAQERVMGVRHCYPLFSTSAKIIGLDAFLRSDGRQPSRGTVWKLSRSHVPQQRRPRPYIRSPIAPHETAYCAPETRKDVNANRSLWPSGFCSRTAMPDSFLRAFGKTACEFSPTHSRVS
jgi:hypothetical protein